MANKKIMDTTSSRSEYNKVRKIYLEQKGKIHCCICPYHRCENDERKCYGHIKSWSYDDRFAGQCRIRYPNWKLISKNKKQWMKKPLIIKKKHYKYFEDAIELFF